MTHFNLIWGILDVRNLRAPLFGPLPCSGLNWSRTEKSSSLKKAPLKTLSKLSKPALLWSHHKKKRGSYRRHPYGGQSTPSSHQLVLSGRGKSGNRGSRGFDLTQGDKGMETPPPNDSLNASLSPPVEGRLHSFRRDWQIEQCSNNMLNIITNGYVLPFITKPKLARVPMIHSGYKAHQKDL